MQAANDIDAEGQTPSVRLIHGKIGGSNSTLLELEYLRQWQSEVELKTAVAEARVEEIIKQT